MYAHDLFVGNLGMTAVAIHQIEPAPVSALCADMAIQTFRRAVRGGRLLASFVLLHWLIF